MRFKYHWEMSTKDKNTELILSYLVIYQEMLEAESVYEEIKNHANQLKYIAAHAEYEKALGYILGTMDPTEMAELLAQITNLGKSALQDLAENFPIILET